MVQVQTLGPVHSPAGPGPIIQVQVHPYLDLDPDIWGPPGPGPDFGQSSQHLRAVASAHPNNTPRAIYLHNLGVSYRRRFEYFGDVKDIDSSIERHLEAVTSTPLDSSMQPHHLSNLGISYHSRFLRFGEVNDIDLSIKYELKAVASSSWEC